MNAIAKKLCNKCLVRSMLFPRCTLRRPCCMLRGFHTTRPCLRRLEGAFQIDPYTARAETNLNRSSPSRSRPQSHSRKPKKSRAGKQSTDTAKLSSLHNRSVRYPRAVEGANGMGNQNGRPSSPNASTKREACPGASGNASG